jgi:hypothetical protein
MIYETRFYNSIESWNNEEYRYAIIWQTNERKPSMDKGVCGKLIGCLGYNGKVFEIPSGIETIGKSVFVKSEWDCFDPAVEKVVIPASVQTIEEGAFMDTWIQKIKIHPDSPAGIVKKGALYTKDGSTLLWIMDTDEEGNFTVPEGVTRLGVGCFGYDGIDCLALPSSVTEIGIDPEIDLYDGMEIKAPRGSFAIEFAKKHGLDYEEL